MEYFRQGDKYLFNSEQPFLWKMSGMAGYENEIDKTIAHLFYRLLKEIHVAFEENLTSEPVYIYAYKRKPTSKGTFHERLLNLKNKEIDLIFTPPQKDIYQWERLSINDELKIREEIDKKIPLPNGDEQRTIWPNWSEIEPSVNEIRNKSRIPDAWWIGAESGENIKYYGFVIKDLVYYPAYENKFINFHSFRQYPSSNLLKKSQQDFAILEYSDKSQQHGDTYRVLTPIIATAKLIPPFIVELKEPLK